MRSSGRGRSCARARGSTRSPPVASTTPPRARTSNGPLAAVEPHADDPTVLDDQLGRRRAGAGLDAAVEAALQQAADQSLAGAALVVDPAPLHLLARAPRRALRARATSRSW